MLTLFNNSFTAEVKTFVLDSNESAESIVRIDLACHDNVRYISNAIVRLINGPSSTLLHQTQLY